MQDINHKLNKNSEQILTIKRMLKLQRAHRPLVAAAYYMHALKDQSRDHWMQSMWRESMPSIDLFRVTTVPLTSPRVQSKMFEKLSDRQVYSNFLSHQKMWHAFVKNSSFEEEQWAIFMEDDAAFHPYVKGQQQKLKRVIEYLVMLGADDGFAYLGLCNQAFNTSEKYELCEPSIHVIQQRDQKYGIHYMRACGLCAHGYAVAKWRAMTLFEDIKSVCQFDYHFMDTFFNCFALSRGGFWLAGSDLTSHIDKGHYGILYQERDLGQSVNY